mgnify:FL=1
MELKEIINHSETFRYQLLDRMKSDCDYYLGCGNRSKKYLWADDESEQIEYMKAIYNSFPEEKKPEWLTWAQILAYEKAMIPKKLVLNYKGRDSWDRPVYECNGCLYVDVSPAGSPDIYTKCNNEFDGEPDALVNAKFEFPDGRDTWANAV